MSGVPRQGFAVRYNGWSEWEKIVGVRKSCLGPGQRSVEYGYRVGKTPCEKFATCRESTRMQDGMRRAEYVPHIRLKKCVEWRSWRVPTVTSVYINLHAPMCWQSRRWRDRIGWSAECLWLHPRELIDDPNKVFIHCCTR